MSELSRRSALKLLSANIALIAAGCGKPPAQVLPYVHMPERMTPDVPLLFATALPLGGFGRGVLAASIEGRPIKISGNSLHPTSRGATDLFAEAHVLSLYDPDRSQTCRKGGEITSWESLEMALADRLALLARNGGAGLRLLTGPTTSPTFHRQTETLRLRFPQMRWYVHDPLAMGATEAGTTLAFGRALDFLPRLADADVVVTLDADPLGSGPAQILQARDFADRRRVRRESTAMTRLYALESTPTVTGTKADHRTSLKPEDLSAVAVTIARALGADGLPETAVLSPELASLIGAIVADLTAGHGRALVLAGPGQPADIQALVHWINSRLNAPITYRAPLLGTADGDLRRLVADLDEGVVDTLLISGCNPAYDGPGDLRFDQALLQRAALTLHHGLYNDETAAICGWHAPDSHPLESWGDLRAVEGTASVTQPLIEPLYGTRTLTALLSGLLGEFDTADYDSVRLTWQAQSGANFEPFWRKSLHDGFVPESSPPPIVPTITTVPSITPRRTAAGLTIVLRPDPTLFEGSFANNAWLQECPKPLTKEVWGNSLGLSADDAHRLSVADGGTARLTVSGREMLVPIRVQDGHAPGVLSLFLGHGRRQAGLIGTDVGFNAFPLRTEASPWILTGASLTGVSDARPSYSTQKQFAIDGDRENIYPLLQVSNLPMQPLDRHTGTIASFLAPNDDTQGAARWAMVIDAAACIGCNACVLACQVENNVPVVGPEEIARNRDMHWLRIDAYDLGEADGRMGFQPVPCMHCETAPCEPVCPVGASIHDSEGLNVQVYNRCVGTRFCEANCPYKVRRFNFFGYADGQEYKNLGTEVMHAHNNPNVTVRARGVMEKCTYCVQRISGARREAEKENRPLREGDVTTACQNACPTGAIAFGDRADAQSEVSRLRDEPQHFTLLGKLNTKPRTTYLADVRNPNPNLKGVRG